MTILNINSFLRKITHRKKIKHSVAQHEFYLYNIESFSEAPIEIICIFLLFFMFFQNFCILVIATFSSLSVDVSRSFLTYLIDKTTCQHWKLRQCHFLSIGLDRLSAFYSIPLMNFNGESPATDCLDWLPFSGNILHHFSFLTVTARDWPGWVECDGDPRLCNTPFQACSCPLCFF